jgi:transposase
MPAKKYRVSLTESEREQLSNIARRGKSSARKVKRALILCQADEGLSDEQIAEALLVGASTVSRVRQRFVEEGMESALNERPRPGQRRKLDGKQEAHLVAVACSQAPAGHARWTWRLLADKVVELEFADSISPETVRQVLKKTSSNRGRRRSGAFQR